MLGGVRQRGVALVTVLLIVVIATVAASAMALRQQLDVRRTTRLLELGQGGLFAEGIEVFARQVIQRDDRSFDHLKEDWARLLPPLPVEGWVISGQLTDLQGRFNLNNLLMADGKPDAAALEQLRRLLQGLKLDPELAYAVLDWIDPDSEAAGFQGAEDLYYQARQPGYRAANRLMADVSELRLVRGFDQLKPEQYVALQAQVAVLPARTRLNVNTASPKVLVTMINGLREDGARQLQAEGPYKTLADVLRSRALTGLVTEKEQQTLDIRSDYFLLHAAARREEDAVSATRRELFTTFRRGEDGKVHVVMRGDSY